MYDLIIRGGKIIDGTGVSGFNGDIAVSEGKIIEVGRVNGSARETINADGAIVTPGFIDPHSHYDGQFTWDDKIEPSFSHGVTTVIGGNCGVGFAPVRRCDHEVLIDLMDGVEDIPGIVLSEGIKWNWETFPEYLDLLESRSYTMDIGVHLTHAPLRVYVMGQRALDHEAATEADINAMTAQVRQAMQAGAFGFSAARIIGHKARSGMQVPGTFAADEELAALARAMGENGTGVFQIVPLGAEGYLNTAEERAGEIARFTQLAKAANRPLTYTLQQVHSDPDDWRKFIAAAEQARGDGLSIHPQIATRGLGLILSLDGVHIFLRRQPYRAIANLPLEARLQEMRKPEVRAAILAAEEDDDAPKEQFLPLPEFVLMSLFDMSDPVNYEPEASSSFGVLAAAAGKTLEEYLYDHLVCGPRGGTAVFFALNYVNGDIAHVREMLTSPVTISGLADGGAHSRIICDASLPTFGLTFWARDRTRGRTLPVEAMVRKQTIDNARLYELHDRGVIAPGLRADLNVIDFAALKLHVPRIHHDLPAGGARIMQGSEGYLATVVNGVVTRRHDQDTGARPGRLMRWRRG